MENFGIASARLVLATLGGAGRRQAHDPGARTISPRTSFIAAGHRRGHIAHLSALAAVLAVAACDGQSPAPSDADEATSGVEVAVAALGLAGPVLYDLSIWTADPNDPAFFFPTFEVEGVEGRADGSLKASYPCVPGAGRVDITAYQLDEASPSLIIDSTHDSRAFRCSAGHKASVSFDLVIPVAANAGFVGVRATVSNQPYTAGAEFQTDALGGNRSIATDLAIERDDGPAKLMLFALPSDDVQLTSESAGSSLPDENKVVVEVLSSEWSWGGPTMFETWAPLGIGKGVTSNTLVVRSTFAETATGTTLAEATIERSAVTVQCNEAGGAVSIQDNGIRSIQDNGLLTSHDDGGFHVLTVPAAAAGKVLTATRSDWRYPAGMEATVLGALPLGTEPGVCASGVMIACNEEPGEMYLARCELSATATSCDTDANGALVLYHLGDLL